MGVPDPADIPPTPELAAASPRPVLVARCENFHDDDFDGAPCVGRIHFRCGMSQAACDTCGAYCGIAVAAWERVEAAGAVPDTGQAREPDGVSSSSGEPYGPGTIVDVIAEEINETVGMKVSWPRISGIAHRAASRLRREGLLGPSGDTVQARESRAVYPQVWCDDASGPNGIGGTCVLGPSHLHRDGLGGEWPVDPSGDTVQAPDVTEPIDWLARFCAAAEAADNQGWTGTAVNLYDLASQLSPNDEDDSDAVIEAIGRALLGTDTTPGDTVPDPAVDMAALTDVEARTLVSDHPTMSELKDYKPRWTAEGVDYEADWNIRPDHLTIGADRLRDSAINAAWVQMRNHLPHEHWSTEACDAIVEATLRTVRDWVEAP